MHFIYSESSFKAMKSKESFDRSIRSMDINQAERVIASLENFTADFRIEHVVPGITVLLNFVYELPKATKGMFEFDSDIIVERVVYRLLSIVDSKDRVEELLVEILRDVKTLSARLCLIQMVGYRESVGHELISRAYASQIERNWRKEVVNCDTAELLKEPKLLLVLCIANEIGDESDSPITIDASDEMTLALLRSAETESIRSKGNLVDREKLLQWDSLVLVTGDERVLNDRIFKLRDISAEDIPLIELSKKYASGWRPPRFPIN